MNTSRCLAMLVLLLGVATGSSAGIIGGVDVRLGAAQGSTDARSAIFDSYADDTNQYYYAVVVWNESWSFNFSSDGGATWFRSYSSGCTSPGTTAADMAVSGAWVYVGYHCDLPSFVGKARVRRFALGTGDLDTSYDGVGSHEVLDTFPAAVVDISVETNIDTDDDRVYFSLIQSDGVARTFWDDPADGTNFTEASPNVFNAEGGLDMHWNPGFATYSLFLSLVDLAGDIQVWRYDGSWSEATSFAYSGSHVRSAISAFGDQVVVAYLAPATHGQGVQYRQSSDGGTTWGPGTFVAEPTSIQGDFFGVDITARGGAGLAVVYNHEAGATDWSLFQSKPDYNPGPWTRPASFNDFDSHTAYPIAINWTPTDHYGVIYVGNTNELSYFDLLEPATIFLDGFESGDTSAWTGSGPLPRQK